MNHPTNSSLHPYAYSQLSTPSEHPYAKGAFTTSTGSLSKDMVFQDLATLSNRSRFVRLFTFLLLEIGYIVLAISCYLTPLLLPSSLTFSESKGFLTVIFIAWQTLAILPVSKLLIHVFSGEWSFQLSRTGRIVPGVTDKVSTLNASLLDRVTHLLFGVASRSFTLAFLVSIILMALTGLAPGTFSTSFVPVNEAITIPIGNFTLTTQSDSDDGFMEFPIERAELIARLEHIYDTQFGYGIQSNWIVGWPQLDPEGVNGTLEYPSDGVNFQYECKWEAPVVQWADVESTWVTPQSSWVLSYAMPDAVRVQFNALLLPLNPAFASIRDDNSSRTAYLFLGSNSTFDTDPNGKGSQIDLSGIPATYNASGYVFATNSNFVLGDVNRTDPSFYAPPLALVLECDPRMNISSVTVVRETNHTLHILPGSSSPAQIGNIPEGAADILFTESLLSATSKPEPYGDTTTAVNYFSASLFMADPTMDSPSKPLDLPTINAHIDAYVSSASKAYSGGYRPKDGSFPIGDFVTLPVNGTVKVQRLALAVSKPLMITTIVAVVVSAIFLAALILREEKGWQPFGLGNIIRELQKEQYIM